MSAVAEVVCLLEKINLNKNEFLKDELIKASMKDFENLALKVAELSNSNHVTLESLSDLIKKESKKVLSSILDRPYNLLPSKIILPNVNNIFL